MPGAAHVLRYVCSCYGRGKSFLRYQENAYDMEPYWTGLFAASARLQRQDSCTDPTVGMVFAGADLLGDPALSGRGRC